MADTKKTVRHLLGLSGGKDSAALAIYLRDKVPEMEYYFTDTGAELPETLEFIDVLEDFLGKKIERLNADRDFEYFLKLHNNFLPSAQRRWCTINLKIIPFEEFVGDDEVISYIAIRADEPSRTGHTPTKPNIKTCMPFREDNITKEDVINILESCGIGLPKYYSWRSRSGCYFCFFQKQREWSGLKEHHPGFFEKAKSYEKFYQDGEAKYTWNQLGPLEDVVKRAEANKALDTAKIKPRRLFDQITSEDTDEDDDDSGSCFFCMK